MAAKITKSPVLVTPLSFEAPSRGTLPNFHKNLIQLVSRLSLWARFLSLMVWVHLLSNFRDEL